MSLVDIAKCIKNSKESDSVKNDVHALLNGEIEQLQTETGAGGEKETRIKEEAALVSLLYSKKDAIDRIEEMLPIKLDRAGKEISKAMNWEERTQVYVDETRKKTEIQTTLKFLELMDAESIRRNLDRLGELIADTQIKQCLAGKGIKV
ncbi:MAG: hypothetical protein HFI39_14875 [Lachnospiraceae bacterium]|nr:hypothetical protein [Lachnospiraceae bacterium]